MGVIKSLGGDLYPLLLFKSKLPKTTIISITGDPTPSREACETQLQLLFSQAESSQKRNQWDSQSRELGESAHPGWLRLGNMKIFSFFNEDKILTKLWVSRG